MKTIRFDDAKYVGDPLNAVRIFNEKQVDELVVLDIDATLKDREPDYQLIANLAAECRMPLCYGGGIKSVDQVQKIISLGVEKVALSSVCIPNSDLISQAAERVGSQSIVVIIDVKKTGIFRRYEVFTHNGKNSTGLHPVEFAKKMQELGAGEIVVNSIDQDGMMKGYDLELISQIRDVISIPLTALGGAGSLKDIQDLIQKFGIIGAAVGSFFVFKGKYRAVLISYPSCIERGSLIREKSY